jgi:hypothetical protein
MPSRAARRQLPVRRPPNHTVPPFTHTHARTHTHTNTHTLLSLPPKLARFREGPSPPPPPPSPESGRDDVGSKTHQESATGAPPPPPSDAGSGASGGPRGAPVARQEGVVERRLGRAASGGAPVGDGGWVAGWGAAEPASAAAAPVRLAMRRPSSLSCCRPFPGSCVPHCTPPTLSHQCVPTQHPRPPLASRRCTSTPRSAGVAVGAADQPLDPGLLVRRPRPRVGGGRARRARRARLGLWLAARVGPRRRARGPGGARPGAPRGRRSADVRHGPADPQGARATQRASGGPGPQGSKDGAGRARAYRPVACPRASKPSNPGLDLLHQRSAAP